MCGICGKLCFDGSGVAPELLQRMADTLVHRGPDDQGARIEGPVGLGERRLSIIDLRHAATAPLPNEDRTIWVVFNGEIYNYRELGEELRERGHLLATASDTEVLVHLYEEYGTGMLARLRGMFAFALWDARRQLLFCARDRLGKKPFVYARSGRALVFGSEIKAVTADPAVAVEPDYAALDAYLTHQYVPSPRTAFRGVHKLPAAHFLTCTAAGELKVERYWSPPAGPVSSAPEAELQEELVARLREAVRLRLRADVPLGAFLSGGIDSATVVALMAQESAQPVRTFTIALEGDYPEQRNEAPLARLVAERWGTRHEEITVRPQLAELLPLLVRHYNEPFADSSAIPTYYVSRAARGQVTVALSGDGGDESFAGYEHYARVAAWARTDRVPRPLRRGGGRAAGALLRALPYSNLGARAERAAGMAAGTLPERYALQLSTLKPQERRALQTPRFRALAAEAGGEAWAGGAVAEPPAGDDEALAWMMRHDLQHYLPDCLMVKTDIASMAVSLEVRCPFLDHQLVEFAATIPARLKRVRGGPGKQVLRRAVAPLLPPALLDAPKSGFGVPLAAWLRGELRPLLEELLLDGRAARRGLLRPEMVRRMVREHLAARRDWSNRLWALLFMEAWFRAFID